MIKISKTLKILYSAFMILAMLWFVASWVDIVLDNLSLMPNHHSWNLLIRLMEWF